MRKLSYWAHTHKLQARFTIICCYILLNILGLLIGDILNSMGFEFSPFLWLLCMLITCFGVIIYPSRKAKYRYRNFYARQKFADGLLILSTFFFIIYFGNSTIHKPQTIFTQAFGISIMKNSPASKNVSVREKGDKGTTSVSKKDSRKNFRKTIRKIRKKYRESTKGQKTLYIILAVLVAAVLIEGVAILACNLSCSGSEALAMIVGYVGIFGIIFALVKVIQRITRGKRKDKLRR